MCGFAGIYKYKAVTPEDAASAESMAESLRRRGPGSGVFAGERAVFGFRKASAAEGGAPPDTDESGRFTLICNGAIYNGRELKAQLEAEGERLHGGGDGEVILRLYALFGTSFVEKLRGVFALLIYDAEKKTLFAARDPFGVKPLYYRESKDGKVFASELKAFRFDKSYDGLKVDRTQLQHYLTFQYVPEPETVTGDIFTLPKGSFMLCDGAKTETRRYWSPVFRPDAAMPYDEKKRRLRRAVEDSVARHMADGVPLGSFLSSGVDSAVVTALAAKLRPGIKAFTIGFDVKGYSEIDDAAALGRHFDIDHVKLRCTADDFVRNFEKTIYSLDAPVGDPSVVAIYLVCREAAKQVKAVLAGEGSDELFAGYRVYDTARSGASLRRLPRVIKAPLYWLSRLLPDGVRGKNLIYRGCVPLEKRFVGNSFVFSEREKKKLYLPYDKNVRFTDRTAEIYAEAKANGYSELLKMQHCDLNTWLTGDILVKGDRLSMANSLKVRVPLLDKEVFAAASVLTDGDKLRNGTTKYIFRDAFRDLLDEETVLRPKLGYPVPVRVWLKDELYDWARGIIKENPAEEYINTAEALKLLEKNRRGHRDLYHQLWTLIAFITWYKLYIASGGES